jgi:hypothetical protein
MSKMPSEQLVMGTAIIRPFHFLHKTAWIMRWQTVGFAEDATVRNLILSPQTGVICG